MMVAWCSGDRGWVWWQCAGDFMDRSLSCYEANVYYLQSVVRARGECLAVIASRPWWLRAPMRHVGVMAASERGDQSKCHLDWSGLGCWRPSKTAKIPANTVWQKRQTPLPSSGKGGLATGIGDVRPGPSRPVDGSAPASVRRGAVPSRPSQAGAGDPGF
jgi:hypothetical protein